MGKSYAVFIPEGRWMCDLRGVIQELEAMPTTALRRRFEALRAVAPLLTYDHTGSHALGAALLWEAKTTCSWPPFHPINDTAIYPLGVPVARIRQDAMVLNGTSVARDLKHNSVASTKSIGMQVMVHDSDILQPASEK